MVERKFEVHPSKPDDGSDTWDKGKTEIKDGSLVFWFDGDISEMDEERNMLGWGNYELHVGQ